MLNMFGQRCLFKKKVVEAYIITNGTDQWIQWINEYNLFILPGDCWENEVREILI